MTKYLTRQRKSLLELLSGHADEPLSARQISELSGEVEISISAVYRNLAALEHDGFLKRIAKPGSREVYYQYVNAPKCRGCLHLACKKCGKIFHMDTDGAEHLVRIIAEQEGFSVDKSETVLYGLCEVCQRA